MAQARSKHAVVAQPKEQKKSARQKLNARVSDEALIAFLRNAHKGEKRTEAGIKYWFEQTVVGHQTEESNNHGAPDGYTPGWLLLELKGKTEDWMEGFFQGLARKDRSYKLLVVACHKTLLVFPSPNSTPSDWDEQKLQEWKKLVKDTQNIEGSPSKVGKEAAAVYKKKSYRLLQFAIFRWSSTDDSLLPASQTEDEAIASFKHLVTTFDPKQARVEITPRNFASILKSLLPYFDASEGRQFEVVHGFFRCMSFWNQKYIPVASDDPAEQDRVVIGGGYFEGLRPEAREDFNTSVQRYEVRDPEKARYYAYYDKAIDAVDPEYRANHGIYFTNEYLARLAITLSEKHIGSIADKYIVFDPACGSGNLVTSWNHHLDLRHKVVSEISPVLLKAFELRFQGKSSERKKGFTIIPKTSSGEGLNFVSQDAASYLERINVELKATGHKLNKPLAIICNPPYRNQKTIKEDFYKYDVHESLVDIAGKDAANELFVAFLAQISEICRLAEENKFPPNSVVLLFTKSVWLTGKSSYSKICKYFLSRFKEKMGIVVSSTEFFDVKQNWPLVCSLWEYQPDANLDPDRHLQFRNLLELQRSALKDLAGDKATDYDDLSNWGNDQVFVARLNKLLKSVEKDPISYNRPLDKLKDHIPPQAGDGNIQLSVEMLEKDQFLGGLCFYSDEQRKTRLSKLGERIIPVYERNQDAKKAGKKKTEKLPSFKVQGYADGETIGFTEGKQPFRTRKLFKNDGTNLFFMMDTRFIKIGTSQCFSGVPTTRGHVASGLSEPEKNLIMGYAMAQSLVGKYPVEYDQFDLWLPHGKKEDLKFLFELSAAFVYTLNGCIECEVPGDHPAKGAKRVFVVNPLAPNKGTFWETHLRPLVKRSDNDLAKSATAATDGLFRVWHKWIADHPSYRAKADLPIYQYSKNKVPSDGWGIYQIEAELKLLPDEPELHKANEKRKEALKSLRSAIQEHLSRKLNYWGQ